MAAPANAPASLNIVLVVDSDVLVRMAVCEYLRHCGYRVFEAATAEEAITLLQRTTIPVDVVLTAVDLSGPMNGFGLSQWVRSNRPGTDVRMGGTAERAVDAAAQLCDSGPMRGKPHDTQVVHQRLKKLLAARARQQKP
jgi:DNA-binding response OmpR family regulator